MALGQISSRLQFLFSRLGEKLWIKPLLASVASVAVVFAAKAADGTPIADVVPSVTVESIQTLLSIMASSVLVIASLAVASMVSAYASASNTASPRAFPLVVADDRSQYALSAFVATFIYSIVGLIASKNGYFGAAGRFVLFLMTLVVLAVVVLTFVTWIDRIARLGRLGVTIEQVERAAARSMHARRETPFLGGHPQRTPSKLGVPLYASEVGFLQHIDMSGLQEAAEELELRFEIAALPGTFVTPDRVVAYCVSASNQDADTLRAQLADNIVIGRDRTFRDDPRFGLVVLSQIAGKALSPGINDPGTAIDVIGVLVRLFVNWNRPRDSDADQSVSYDRISVPPLREDDMFDDAFTAIARDGASSIEVVTRLLKGLQTLAHVGDQPMQTAAVRLAQRTIAQADQQTHLPEDRERMRRHAAMQ